MLRSQSNGRTNTTRRARRPDGGIYRTLRMRRSGGRRQRRWRWLASGVVVLLVLAAVWLLFW